MMFMTDDPSRDTTTRIIPVRTPVRFVRVQHALLYAGRLLQLQSTHHCGSIGCRSDIGHDMILSEQWRFLSGNRYINTTL